jgi:flagellar protein FlaE
MDDDSDSDSDGDGGKSFAELKDEYESGDADWADDEASADSGDLVEDDDDLFEDQDDDSFEADDDLADDDLFDEVIDEEGVDDTDVGTDTAEPAQTTDPEPEPDQSVESEPEPEPEPTPDQSVEPEPQQAAEPTPAPEPDQTTTETDETDDDGKPYLDSMPEGFAADLIIVEWLEYLVQQTGYRETSRALEYYETIGWIDESVADQLTDYLRGFDDVDDTGGGLTIDHHTESLRYISQLDEDSGPEAVALSKLVRGGGSDGLQR